MYYKNKSSLEIQTTKANHHSTNQLIPEFYGNRRFITVYTRARHDPYSEPESSIL